VKNIISGATPKKTIGMPPSLQIASERISKQKRTIERLETENNQLLEQLNEPLVSKRQ
jgi:hypothetical protein